jgi:stage IV sporulation protein FB
VMIHELGHAVAAKSYGWKVTEIRLFPFGGVMEVDEQGHVTSTQEIIVAICGPLQNVLMIGAAFALRSLDLWEPAWADYFIQANMWVALFNLIPVLPLDGGRIVQALLHRFYSYYRTVIVGAWASMLISVMMALFAIFQNNTMGIHMNVMIVAIFLLFSNWYSYKHVNYVFIRFLIGREQHHSARVRKQGSYVQPIVVQERYKTLEVAKLFIRERYHTIYIVREDGSIRTVIPEWQLITRFLAGRFGDDDAEVVPEPNRAEFVSVVQ